MLAAAGHTSDLLSGGVDVGVQKLFYFSGFL